MYLHEPYGIAATSSHITHSREQHLLINDSLYDFSTFKRKRLVILEPKTASHYHDQSLPVIDQSLPGPEFHDQSFASHPITYADGEVNLFAHTTAYNTVHTHTTHTSVLL